MTCYCIEYGRASGLQGCRVFKCGHVDIANTIDQDERNSANTLDTICHLNSRFTKADVPWDISLTQSQVSRPR